MDWAIFWVILAESPHILAMYILNPMWDKTIVFPRKFYQTGKYEVSWGCPEYVKTLFLRYVRGSRERNRPTRVQDVSDSW